MLTDSLIALLEKIQNGLINIPSFSYAGDANVLNYGCATCCSGDCEDDCAGACVGDCSGACKDACSGSCAGYIE